MVPAEAGAQHGGDFDVSPLMGFLAVHGDRQAAPHTFFPQHPFRQCADQEDAAVEMGNCPPVAQDAFGVDVAVPVDDGAVNFDEAPGAHRAAAASQDPAQRCGELLLVRCSRVSWDRVGC